MRISAVPYGLFAQAFHNEDAFFSDILVVDFEFDVTARTGDSVDFNIVVFVFAVVEDFDGVAFFDFVAFGGDVDSGTGGWLDAIPGKGGQWQEQRGDNEQYFFHGVLFRCYKCDMVQHTTVMLL